MLLLNTFSTVQKGNCSLAHVLQGRNLNLALEKHDYHVLVGTEECTVQWVDIKELTCKPPPSSKEGVGNNPKVTVSIATTFMSHWR